MKPKVNEVNLLIDDKAFKQLIDGKPLTYNRSGTKEDPITITIAVEVREQVTKIMQLAQGNIVTPQIQMIMKRQDEFASAMTKQINDLITRLMSNESKVLINQDRLYHLITTMETAGLVKHFEKELAKAKKRKK